MPRNNSRVRRDWRYARAIERQTLHIDLLAVRWGAAPLDEFLRPEDRAADTTQETPDAR